MGPTPVGPNDLTGLLAAATHFKSYDGITGFLGSVESQLPEPIARFDLVAKLSDGPFNDGRPRVRLVFVTTGILNPLAKRLVKAQNSANGKTYVTVYDLSRLGPIAAAVTAQEIPNITVGVPVPQAERVVLGKAPNRSCNDPELTARILASYDALAAATSCGEPLVSTLAPPPGRGPRHSGASPAPTMPTDFANGTQPVPHGLRSTQ